MDSVRNPTISSDEASKLAVAIAETAGSLRSAVYMLADVDRELWRLSRDSSADERKHYINNLLVVIEDMLRETAIKQHARAIVSLLEESGSTIQSRLLSRPFTIASRIMRGFSMMDIKYFTARNILERNHSPPMLDILRPFKLISSIVNKELGKPRDRRKPMLINQLFDTWSKAFRESNIADINSTIDYCNLFVESCRMVGYVVPNNQGLPYVIFDTQATDVEYAINSLYGCPTDITGFNELFGGNGLYLADVPKSARNTRRHIGRSILIKGRFGTGKSTLALQIIAAAAKKAGRVIYIPLEQPPSECKYMLESSNALDGAWNVDVCSNINNMHESMQASYDSGIGKIMIYNISKLSNELFLNSLSNSARMLGDVGLRLVAIDPINAINRDIANVSVSELRMKFHEVIGRLKDTGINVLIVAEEETDKTSESLFEENVVDTVIHLTEQSTAGCSRRHLEIQKSRLQRERRGLHAYVIRSGEGLHIYPSSSAVDDRLRHRRMLSPDKIIEFGHQKFDEILGKGTIRRGDVFAFLGATGSYKTQLGFAFLMEKDDDSSQREVKSLLIAAKESKESLLAQLRSEWMKKAYGTARVHSIESEIIVRCLPLAYVHPGEILQCIEEEFSNALQGGYIIERVVLANIAHWELSCPFVKEDPIFPDTLVALMRRHCVTSLFICGAVSDREISIQRPIIDNADMTVMFEKDDSTNQRRVILQVTKSRNMQHCSKKYEIQVLGPDLSIRINP